ncbi:MAG: hypothetical protein ABIO65_07830 [Nitrospiria bacterium]
MLGVLIGCAYPNQQVHAVDDRPGLYIAGAPADAILYVDGLDMGPASKFDGQPNVLALVPGTHRVEIRRGTGTIHSTVIFLGEGVKRQITVPGGATGQ